MYNKKWFIGLIAPGFIVFIIVLLIPLIIGISLSFTNWSAGQELYQGGWIGFDNYKQAFEDGRFTTSIWYTVLFAILSLVLINVIGFTFAYILYLPFRGKNVFRSVFFLPNLIGGLVVGYLWRVIFDQVFTQIFGGESLRISGKFESMIAMAIVSTWQLSGYIMIIYIAALQNVNKSLLETSKLEGANFWKRFTSVILPAIAPAITISFFIVIKISFKLFDKNLSLTEGVNGTELIALNIWKSAFDPAYGLSYGIAQAKSVIFIVLVSAIAIFQVSISKKFEVQN